MCQHAVKKLPYLIRYVPDHFKTWKMCDKAFNTYLSTIVFVLEYIMTQEMSNKAVNGCFLHLILFLINS